MNCIEDSTRPTLHRGFPLPFGDLSPDSFEDFVYQALSLLGRSKGFEMQSGRQPSGDQGFDCTAKINEGNALVCIQCKRYNTTLQTKTVAEEIVKVALDTTLNESSVKQHYIVTSGNVSGSLRSILRQDSHILLKEECKKLIEDGKFQLSVLKEAQKKSINPVKAVYKYIETLDKLIVWSGVDFRNELLIIWSDLSDILEQHFSIEKVLKEKPTPDFNVNRYLSSKLLDKDPLVPLYYNQTTLPNNLESDTKLISYPTTVLSIEDIYNLINNDKNVVLSSPGGSGKSSTLSMIERKIASLSEDVNNIPVKLKLRGYSRNSLNSMIEHELGISYGSWKSLPFNFIFLLDGLDEMLQCDTQAFYDDLTSTIGNNKYILTVRNTGLTIPTTSNTINICLSIKPLSYRSAFKIASETFEEHELSGFYQEYRKKLSMIGYNFLSSPFVLSLSIEYYKEKKKLPESMEDVLESWLNNKVKNDQSRVTDETVKLNRLPVGKVVDAFALILYKAKFERNVVSISEDAFLELIIECYDEMLSSNQFVARALELNDFIKLLHHYEVLFKDNDEHYYAPHAIISDYLSSKYLASKWKNNVDYEFNSSHHDAWLYCSHFVKEEDKKDFLNTVFNFDICLGARVANKFQASFVNDIQDRLLELEGSEKILTRSNAIHALGLLGTDKCYDRLRSDKGLLDLHHLSQRRRALALNGDMDTLHKILDENESNAQLPIKFSGGDYGLWFSAPPAIITNIARKRIANWVNNRDIPLCMSLRTLALFGDSLDINILSFVIENTKVMSEFHDASKALYEIDVNSLIDLLNKLIVDKKNTAYWAKQCLLSIGVECDIEDEFNFFISLSDEEESYLAEHIHSLDKLVDFLNKTSFDDEKISRLIDVYQKIKFPHDFFYNAFIWRLAQNGRAGAFLPIVKLAYSRKIPSEINNAINYLSSLHEVNIDSDLSDEIDDYFNSLGGKYEGIYHYYVRYYYKHKSKSLAIELIKQKIDEKLCHLTPESIDRKKFSFSFFEYNAIFDYFHDNIDDEIRLEEDEALKFLLIDTEHLSEKERVVKFKILSQVDRLAISNYVKRINDLEVKYYVINYLLFNDLASEPMSLMEEYLPIFLSHYFFYPTLERVCIREWDNNLAQLFLRCFVNHKWHAVNVQMFERYINLFSSLLTREQLESFERERNKPVEPLVQRIYQIWLESKGLY